jgi:hypothetical protein
MNTLRVDALRFLVQDTCESEASLMRYAPEYLGISNTLVSCLGSIDEESTGDINDPFVLNHLLPG